MMRPGARRDRGFNAIGVDVVGVRVGLDGNRRGSGIADGKPSGDIGVGGTMHLIAGADAECAQSEMKRVEPAADADAVFARSTRRILFEGLYLFAEDKAAAAQDAPDRVIDFLVQLEIGCAQIEKGNLRPVSAGRSNSCSLGSSRIHRSAPRPGPGIVNRTKSFPVRARSSGM